MNLNFVRLKFFQEPHAPTQILELPRPKLQDILVVPLLKQGKEVPIKGQMGSICRFPRTLSASKWGHCSQVLVSTSIWGS